MNMFQMKMDSNRVGIGLVLMKEMVKKVGFCFNYIKVKIN